MKKITALVLVFVMLIPMAVSVAADYENDATDCNYNRVVSKKKYELTSGATETEYVLNTWNYSDRNEVNAVEVDPSNPNISVQSAYYGISENADYSFSSYRSYQTVLEHANYAKQTQGKDVVAAINISSAWNCNAPYGLLIYNGVKLYDGRKNCSACGSSHKGGGYLVITKDGRAELREPDAALTGNELHAVTLMFNWLVKNGTSQYGEDHSAGVARTAIGIKTDGTLVLVTNEYTENSNGMTYHELADTMRSLGCENAIACEGGGATVMYTKRNGESELSVRTKPSDGVTRATSTSLLITAKGYNTSLKTVASGKCGLLAQWTLDSYGNLTVYGSGSMYDFDAGAAPWHQYTDRYPITRVVIEEGITSVGDRAFTGYGTINSVSLPSTLKSIGYRSFMDCSSLSYIYIPDSVESFGSSAFARCTSLGSITLPEYMTSIGSSCFYGCSSLQSIVLPYGIDEISYQLFVNCTALKSVQVRTKKLGVNTMGATKIAQYAFSGCTALKSFTVPDTVYGIEAEAFEYCNQLTLTIPQSVKVIEDRLFYMASECSIKCVQYSYAEEYAMTNSIPYQYTEESRIENKLGEVDLGPYNVEGAYVDFGGTVIPLIDLEASVEVGAGELKFVSNEDGTVKILLGFDDSNAANIKGADENDSYWSDAYKEVKDLYTGVTGKKVDTTRLWNGFSSLRSKLRKNNASMVVRVDSSVVGYLEFKETDGEFVFSEGGLIAEFSAETNVRTHNPVYVVMGVGVNAKGEIYFKNNNGMIKPDMRLESALSLTMGLGCDAAVGYIEGYATGTLYCDVDSASATPFRLSAGVNGLFHGSVFGREFLNQPFDFGTIQLYPKTRSSSMALSREMNDIAGYTAQINEASALDRAYLTEGSEVSSVNAYFRKDNAYPYTYPVLTSFDDGSMMTLWTDDTGEKTADNAGTIMYSYYNGSYWSDPLVMYEDGCNNSSPTLYSDGSKAYIVWQKATRVFCEDTATSDMLKTVDLYICRFDPETMSFTEPVCITSEEEEIFEFSPHIINTDEGIRVYWIENSDNNLFMMSGINSVYCRDIYADGTMSDKILICESADVVSDVAVTATGAYYSIYSEDKMTLYFEDGSVIAEDIDRIEAAENSLYYTKDGELYCHTHRGSFTFELSSCVDDITIVSKGGYTYLFTSVLNVDGTKTLYYSKLDTERGSSGPFEKYSSEVGYIGSYSPCVLPDGELHVAYSYITKAEDGSYLDSSVLVDATSGEIETEISYVVFDNTDLGDSELKLSVGFHNHSPNEINSVDICISDGDGTVITEDVISVDIEAYSDQELEYTLMHDGSVDKITVMVVPSDHTDYNSANNSVATTLECIHKYSGWQTTLEPTYLQEGREEIYCEDCKTVLDSRSIARQVPEISVDNYSMTVTGAEYIKDMRYAPGVYTPPAEIKEAEGTVAIDNNLVVKNTVDGSFVYEMPKGGYYTIWIRMLDGTNYILPLDVTRFTPYVSVYGVKITLHNLYDVKDFYIAKGEYQTYREIKDNGYIVSVTGIKIADKHDYGYTVYEPGVHTILIRYNDGSQALFHETLTVDEPVFTTNGLQVIVSNLPDVKVIRTAYGKWNSVKELKATDTIRNFSSKTAIKGKDPYTIQYREEGTVTVIVEYNNGYQKVFHYEVTKKTPTMTQQSNNVTLADLDGLVMIRYAAGEYSTSGEIKRAPGSKVIKPDAIVGGKITVADLLPGTYTFCVQYDDESYNYYIFTVE